MQGNSTDNTSVDKSIGNSISYETNSKVRVFKKKEKTNESLSNFKKL